MGPLDWRHLPQTFGVCLGLALTYSFLFLVLGWAFFGGTGHIAPTEFLPDAWSDDLRKLFAIGSIFYIVAVLFLFRWALRRGRWWAHLLGIAVISAFAGVGALALALGGGEAAFAVAFAGAIALFFAALLTLALLRYVAGGFAGAGAVAGSIALAGAGTGAFGGGAMAAAMLGSGVLQDFLLGRVGDLPATLVMLGLTLAAVGGLIAVGAADGYGAQLFLFWALLPFANMLWDGPSWLASRWLGGHLLKVVRDRRRPLHSKARSVGLHVVVDLLLAAVFLVALAATLPPLVEAFNTSTSARIGEAPFPLTATADSDLGYLCAVARDPWGEGSWAMLMLVSTLVPTVLHALTALAALFAVPAIAVWRSQDLARRLFRHVPKTYTKDGGGLDHEGRAALDDAARRLAWTWLLVWVAVAMGLGGGWWLWHELQPTLPGWLAVGIETFREFLLGTALWDFAAARDCLAAGPA